MLRKIRILLAVIFMAGISMVFLDFTGTVRAYLDWMTSVQFWPAVLALNAGVVGMLIVLTLLLGRVYCSVVCPLGIFQDIVSWLSSKRKGKKARFSYRKPLTLLRYGIAVLFVLVFALVSASWASLIEPYSAFGRMVSALAVPIYGWGNNLFDAVAARFDSYMFYPVDVVLPSMAVLAVAVLTFAAVAACAWVGGRTYCNRVCPVGAVLGAISKWSLLRPQIDLSKCNGCGICEKKCKGSCISSADHAIDYSRCVVCMDCLENCRHGAISFRPRTVSHVKTDKGRRSALSLLAAVAASVGIAAAEDKVIDLGRKTQSKGAKTIVPAGAGSVLHLKNHCIACQKCVTACPSHVLKPSTGLEDFMQPHMEYADGYCRIDCDVCGNVCPTGAMRPVTMAEKSSTQIGHAVWMRSRCIVHKDGRPCGNCARHCPTGAIRMVKMHPDVQDSLEIPVVDKSMCIGCGACEHVCPSRPQSAIFVKGFEVHHLI